ncbi:MAG: hypothetical protein WB777_22545 [Mycobacterium sp.]
MTPEGTSPVGLGIGAAVASSPGIASADSSTNWLSSIDSLLGAGLPAQAKDVNLGISFDGYSLADYGNATATTISGQYGIAIAYGDYAFADGTNALAEAGGSASDTGANNDTATAIGNNDIPSTGLVDNGAYAGNGDLAGGTGTGSDEVSTNSPPVAWNDRHLPPRWPGPRSTRSTKCASTGSPLR